TEVARYLGLPVFSTAGCTDSKCLDEQAAAEAATSIVIAALSGANFVHDVGYTESGMTGSLHQLVMGDEIIGMARFIARGIRVDDETLAVDAIAEAAETGDYLALDHTAKHFRREFWFPSLMDRRRYGEWAGDGKKTLGDRAGERVRRILADHRAARLTGEVETKLDRLVGD
ncbi:MAG TPA: trimethylamine methyltransferase family protein, partial [Phycisphaerae bacterium]|nr:trimethylamine methyltransferase family protein [Phycisphaerae bacterium]